jgi:glutaredoxin 3
MHISEEVKSSFLRVIFYGINGKRLVYKKSFVSGLMLSAKPIIDSGGVMVAEDVIIYGKPGCPFTDQALSAYGKKATYFNVESDKAKLQEMLKVSGGVRKVPVIVEGTKVTIGYGGT